MVEALGVTDAKTKTLATRLKGLGIDGQPTLLVVVRGDRRAQARRAQRAVALGGDARARVGLPAHPDERVVFEKAALLALQETLKS